MRLGTGTPPSGRVNFVLAGATATHAEVPTAPAAQRLRVAAAAAEAPPARHGVEKRSAPPTANPGACRGRRAHGSDAALASEAFIRPAEAVRTPGVCRGGHRSDRASPEVASPHVPADAGQRGVLLGGYRAKIEKRKRRSGRMYFQECKGVSVCVLQMCCTWYLTQ